MSCRAAALGPPADADVEACQASSPSGMSTLQVSDSRLQRMQDLMAYAPQEAEA